MVVLGDSIAWGMSSSRPGRAWATIAAAQLRRFGSPDLRLINRGIPANVISPRNPSYPVSARPSLIERIDVDCIRLQPDLVVIAEGTNDLRAGMRSADYAADLTAITTAILRETKALVVLVGVYPQAHGYGANDPAAYPDWTRWQPADLSSFSCAAGEVAQQTGALFVDALDVLGGMDIVLDRDGCHLNDLGHQLIGNAVFRTVILGLPPRLRVT